MTVKKKYTIVKSKTKVNAQGITLYRIKALRSFCNDGAFVRVKKGQLGGWVENKDNLSQNGTCWINDDAEVFNNATVTRDAYVADKAKVFDGAKLIDKCSVVENAIVKGKYTCISDNAHIGGNVEVGSNKGKYTSIYGYSCVVTKDKIVVKNVYIDSIEIFHNCTKQPIVLYGFDYDVVVLDNHIQIGCQSRTFKEWKNTTKEAVARLMRSKRVGNLFDKHKKLIFQIIKASGRKIK